MLVVISPAKKLDFESRPVMPLRYTKPAMLKSTEGLINVVRELSHKQLVELMKISDKLVILNQRRFREFSTPFTKANAKPAVLTFMGDTYQGLDAGSMSVQDLEYAQEHLRILSGLYGVLRPLDLMQAYRLEMGTKLKTPKGDKLYDFWGEQITLNLNKSIARTKSKHLINCASNEYFRAIQPALLKAEVITPVFKQVKDGHARMTGMMAKRARGAMARFIMQNKIEHPEDLREFKVDGYRFQDMFSDSRTFEFHRQV